MYDPERDNICQTIQNVVNYILESTDICLVAVGNFDGWNWYSKSQRTINDQLYSTLQLTANSRKYLETEVNYILQFVGYHKKLYFEEQAKCGA